jgi:glutaminyl-tRNA synthetase
MDDGDDYIRHLNPNSLEILTSSRVEPSLKSAPRGGHFQFERIGYFCVDPVDSCGKSLVFNRTATLRDSWAKVAGKEKK